MRQTTRERAMRVLLAAFVSSDLTIQELEELHKYVLNSPAFLADLSLALKDVVRRLRAQEPRKEIVGRYTAIDQALASVKRRRLSKAALLEMMRAASPDADDSNLARRSSAREMISAYLAIASPIQRAMFLDMLGASRAPEDAYLKGIVGRRSR